MVNEVCYKSNAASCSADFSARSQESKRAGFQNMQKMDQVRKLSMKAQQAPKAANAFGPMFRDREHFSSLHFC